MIRNKVKTLIYNYMKIVNFIQEYKDIMEDIIIHKVATATTTTSEVIVKEEQGNIIIHLVAHDDHILIVKDYC